ncbi:MAG TPA: transposase [Chthoniobacteraceae bacterium]|nr:transposase [Chthoniobacteraceae bacterium]
MRSRYRFNDPHAAHFITSTIVEWLPVFTTSACCDILIQSLKYCRKEKSLRIHGWVILDNHFHAIVSGPELADTIRDLKRFTSRALLDQIRSEKRDWLLNQLAYYRPAHRKAASEHQVWQEGVHPQAIVTDEMMLQKLEYVHNNPVKRRLVASPEHWTYSSAHEWLPGAIPVLKCDPWR